LDPPERNLTYGCNELLDDHYKYVAVYVDDLAISSKDPRLSLML